MEDAANPLPDLAGSDLLAPDIDLDPEFEDIVNDAVEVTDGNDETIIANDISKIVPAHKISGIKTCDIRTENRLDKQNISPRNPDCESHSTPVEQLQKCSLPQQTFVTFQQSFELCIRKASEAPPILLDDDEDEEEKEGIFEDDKGQKEERMKKDTEMIEIKDVDKEPVFESHVLENKSKSHASEHPKSDPEENIDCQSRKEGDTANVKETDMVPVKVKRNGDIGADSGSNRADDRTNVEEDGTIVDEDGTNEDEDGTNGDEDGTNVDEDGIDVDEELLTEKSTAKEENCGDVWQVDYIREERGGEITSLLHTKEAKTASRKRNHSCASKSGKKKRKADKCSTPTKDNECPDTVGRRQLRSRPQSSSTTSSPHVKAASFSKASTVKPARKSDIIAPKGVPLPVPDDPLMFSPPKLVVKPAVPATCKWEPPVVQELPPRPLATAASRQSRGIASANLQQEGGHASASHLLDWSRLLGFAQPSEYYKSSINQLLSSDSDNCFIKVPSQDSWGLEASSCPGCCRSFLLPTTFFQHLYRRSLRIRFECRLCDGKYLEFSNKCLFRIHLLSHLELGQEPKAGGLLELSSLEIDELTGVKRGANESFLSHRRTLNQLPKAADEVQCMECLNILADKHQLQQHLQPAVKTESLEQLRCESCQRVVASPCSLAAHRRIHARRPPYICPECGQEFLTWTIFKMHLGRSCLHDARVPLFTCPLCPHVLFPLQLSILVDHISSRHLREAHKCGRCSSAFPTKARIREHARQMHRGQRTPYYRLYRPPPCLTRMSVVFFKSRGAMRTHLLANLQPPIILGYACNGCAEYFSTTADQLMAHAEHCRHSFTGDPLYAERPLDDRYLEAVDDLRRMSGEDGLAPCRGCLKHCRSFRSHICKHHSRKEEVDGRTKIAESKQDAALEQTDKNFEANDQQSNDCTAQRSEKLRSNARLEENGKRRTPDVTGKRNMSGRTTPRHTSPLKLTIKLGSAAEMAAAAAAVVVKSTAAAPPTAGQPSSSLGSASGSAAAKKKQVLSGPDVGVLPSSSPIVESLGIDVPARRDLLTRNHLGHSLDALRVGATVANKDRTPMAASPVSNCSVCRATFGCRAELTAHIRTHRVASGIHLCDECGAGFASAASRSRHLLLVHRIRRPQDEEEEEECDGYSTGNEGDEERPQGGCEGESKRQEEGDSDEEKRLIIDTEEESLEKSGAL